MENQQHTLVINKPASNGFAITALVLGILAVVLNIIPFLPYIMATLAVIFGAIGISGKVQSGMAITGIVLGIVAIAMKIGFWILIFITAAA